MLLLALVMMMVDRAFGTVIAAVVLLSCRDHFGYRLNPRFVGRRDALVG